MNYTVILDCDLSSNQPYIFGSNRQLAAVERKEERRDVENKEEMLKVLLVGIGQMQKALLTIAYGHETTHRQSNELTKRPKEFSCAHTIQLNDIK